MAGFTIGVGEALDATQQFANGFQELQSNQFDGVLALTQVGTALLNLVGSNPLLGQVLGAGLGIVALERELHKLEAELRKPTNEINGAKIAESIVGVVGAVGGVLAAMPFPQVKALGIAISLTAAAVKEYQSGNIRAFIWDVFGEIEKFDFDKIWNSAYKLGSIISATLTGNPDPNVKIITYVMVDPLVLDLDGDGLEITPLSQGVQFDGNGDTIRTNTSWVQADDGLLVLDRNGNGVIDSGRELFGDETLLADGKKAAHGFAALAELDVGGAANATGGAGDGVFDAKDAQYTNVRIWRDLNQDGISQAGEMQTLAEAGIASVKLSSTKTDTSYGDAQLVQSGSFTRTDGSEGQAGSFILAQNNAVTTHAPIAISAEAGAALIAMGTAAAALPSNQGRGWVVTTLMQRQVQCYRQRQRQRPSQAGMQSHRVCGVGQNTAIKLETFPLTRYGTVKASLDKVTQDAVNDEKRGAIFPALLKLNQISIDVDGKQVKLAPGMNITAEIKTGQRRVIEYLLSPIQRAGSESLRER